MPQAPYHTDFGVGCVDYDATGVRSIRLPAQRPQGRKAKDVPTEVEHLVADLEAYFAGSADFVPTCTLVGGAGATPFLRDIYRIVSSIRPGSTMTYGDVAVAAGRPGAARAVGAAMAANPFAPVIPCHRVVGADGRLRGYGGGLDMKRALLAMEARQQGEAYV